MADVAIDVEIYPIVTTSDSQQREAEIASLAELVEKDSSLHNFAMNQIGNVKGHGVRQETGTRTANHCDEEILFITNGPNPCFISASCRAFDEQQIQIYDKIISSIKE